MSAATLKIEVLEITRVDGDDTAILFRSHLGRARARWRLDDPPVIGRTLDVLLELSGTMTWGTEIATSTRTADMLEEAVGLGVRICGELVEADEDAVTVRVGGAELFMYVDGEAPPPGSRVAFETRELKVFSGIDPLHSRRAQGCWRESDVASGTSRAAGDPRRPQRVGKLHFTRR